MSVDVRAATADDLDALATLRPHVHDKHVAARAFFLAQGFAPMRQRLSRAAGGP